MTGNQSLPDSGSFFLGKSRSRLKRDLQANILFLGSDPVDNLEPVTTTEQVAVPLVVTMQRIVKRFPGVLANDHADFELRQGEIHALLGENGAGKSTLMNVLAGLYQADSGIITVNHKEVSFHSPKDAIRAG